MKKYNQYIKEAAESSNPGEINKVVTFEGNVNLAIEYSNEFRKFNEDFLNKLKEKLEGKTSFVKATKYETGANYKKSMYSTSVRTPLRPDYYELNIVEVKYEGSFLGRGDQITMIIGIVDDENNTYRLKEIITEEEYNYRLKEKEEKERKFQEFKKEKLRKEEEKRKAMAEIDPYGEEDWEGEEKKKKRGPYYGDYTRDEDEQWWKGLFSK